MSTLNEFKMNELTRESFLGNNINIQKEKLAEVNKNISCISFSMISPWFLRVSKKRSGGLILLPAIKS